MELTGSNLMERVIASIGELPTSPAVVSSVMGLTSNLNTGVDKLSGALSSDPALTAKVLRLSNSPFYGRARTVQSLNEAIMILGFSTIRSLVVATSTYSMFKLGHDKSLEKALWHHSLATAMGARIVAKRLGKRPLIEEFFLGGLLHDIGILVMLQKMPQEFGKILSEEQATGRNRNEIEQETLGFTHADLGSIVLERWNFPSILSAAVRYHSEPDLASSAPDSADGGRSETLIAHAVAFADATAHSLGYGFENEGEIDLLHLTSTAFLGLTANDIVEISQELGERVAEEQQLFEG
jgi:HD-like signal output (HDOD) protein